MMKKNYLILFFVIVSSFVYAQDDVPQPGGGGINGYGTPASPIDLYIYPLILVAAFIIIFAAKYKKKAAL